MTNRWQNRIVGHGVKAASQFVANAKNWRTHPQAQRDALHGALNEVGWIAPVVENVRTGYLVDGHERVWQALQNGDTDVPFVQVDLSEEEEAYALLTLDPISAMAQASNEQLDALLHDVQSSEAGVQAMLAEVAEKAGLYPEAPKEAPEPQVDRAEELREKWHTERGQLWQIGKHRLLCGDSTNAEDVERLMGGERAVLSHHDPPYGANVVKAKGTSGRGSIGGGKWGPVGVYTLVIGDDVPFDPSHLLDTGDVTVLWGANYYADRLPPSSGWLVWDKRDGMSSNNFADCELAWVSKSIPARLFAHRWSGMVKASEHGQARYHPTQKPIALFAWVIELFTNSGDVVSDWYAGAGGQFVAAEQLGRICYGMEIEPKYCAVILERMAGMGLEPKLT